MSEKNNSALPSGALERSFGLICAILAHLFFGARWKCGLIFFARPIPRKLWPFESTPGHPSQNFKGYLLVLTGAILVAWAIFNVDLPIGHTLHAFCATTAFVDTLEIFYIGQLDALLKIRQIESERAVVATRRRAKISYIVG